MKTNNTNIKRLLKGLLLTVLIATSASQMANAGIVTVSRDFNGNDCTGFFGDNFSSCTIFIGSNGDRIELSPVIAKWENEGQGGTWETNTLYPTVTGNEFTLTPTSGDTEYKTGSWVYTPDNLVAEGDVFDPNLHDPAVKYWATKAGNDFKLFWNVDAVEVATGGVCDVSDKYTLACLSAALVTTSGTWSNPGDKELSHITFYDSVPPKENGGEGGGGQVPEPNLVLLMGVGLLGFSMKRLRKNH